MAAQIPGGLLNTTRTPLDDKYWVQTFNELEGGLTFQGLMRFSRSEDKLYIKLTNGWTQIQTGTSSGSGSGATIKIGKVVSGTSASVKNVGTDANAIFDFVLPKGDNGSAATIRIERVENSPDAFPHIINNGNETNASYVLQIPKGPKGDRGQPFKIDAQGTFANRSAFDTQQPDFTYLVNEPNHIDDGFVYIKLATGWSERIAFKGPRGEKGMGLWVAYSTTYDGLNPTFTLNSTHKYISYLNSVEQPLLSNFKVWVPIGSGSSTGEGTGGNFSGFTVEKVTGFPFQTKFPTTYDNIAFLEVQGFIQRKPELDNFVAPDYTILFDSRGYATIDSVGPEPVSIEGQFVYVRTGDVAGNPTTPRVTPDPPTVVGNDTTNIVSATHPLGMSEIVVSTNNSSYNQYTGGIQVGDEDRPKGYYKFKIKATTSRNESTVVESPEFKKTVVIVQPEVTTPTTPTFIADDVNNTLSFSHPTLQSELELSINGANPIPYTGAINVGNENRAEGYYKVRTKAATNRNPSLYARSPQFTASVVNPPNSDTFRSGTVTLQGTKSDLSYSFPHGFTTQPTSFTIDPQTPESTSDTITKKEVDATNLKVTLLVAPGDNSTLAFNWTATK